MRASVFLVLFESFDIIVLSLSVTCCNRSHAKDMPGNVWQSKLNLALSQIISQLS